MDYKKKTFLQIFLENTQAPLAAEPSSGGGVRPYLTRPTWAESIQKSR